MSLKFGLCAILMLAAAPAVAQAPVGGTPAATPAQPAQPPQPSPAQIQAIQTAAQAMQACMMTGIQNVPASTAPDAGAAAVLAGCETQRQGIAHAVDAIIASLPADQQVAARAEATSQMQSQLAQAQTQIAAAITQQRTAGATPAAAAQPAH
jgi:hypothetical protein